MLVHGLCCEPWLLGPHLCVSRMVKKTFHIVYSTNGSHYFNRAIAGRSMGVPVKLLTHLSNALDTEECFTSHVSHRGKGAGSSGQFQKFLQRCGFCFSADLLMGEAMVPMGEAMVLFGANSQELLDTQRLGRHPAVR